MAISLGNRAKMSTSTTGTGTITLGSAVASFQTFEGAGITNGQTVRYAIEDGTAFEIGSGTYTSSGTTLTRSVTESSNSDSAISLSGNAQVFVTATVADLFINDGASTLTTTGVITGGTVEATSDTAAGDNAAMGYTSAEGLILTGQGSTNDITIKNDADTAVISIPTGGTNVDFVGSIDVANVGISTGVIDLKNGGSQSVVKFYCEVSNAHYAEIKAPAHGSFSGNVTLTLPATTDTIAGIAATQTFTNKTLTSPKINEDVAVTTTATEINLIDGGTSRGTTAVASGDGILINDAGTMRMTNVDTVSTYFSSHSVGGGNIVTTGALNSGSITSGFGTIDNGSSNITTTGVGSFGSLDISGNIDVDGTTNLDVVDIDGAVNVAADLTIASTNKILFNDASQFIQGSSATVLTIAATDEIDLTATTIDINGAVALNGAITGATNITLSGELDAATGDFSGDVDVDGTLEADAITIGGTAIGSIFSPIAGGTGIVTTGALDAGSITSGFGTINNGSSAITTTGVGTFGSLDISGNIDIDGTTNLDAVDIDGAVQLDATLTVGVDDTGYDVKFFGDAASAFMQWDASADDLILGGAAGLIVPEGQFTLGSTAVTSTAAELNLVDGISAGTVSASKAVIVDSNKDLTGGRNLTISGELDAATLDISGNADIDGTLETDGLTVGGVAAKVAGKESIWIPAAAMYPSTTNGCSALTQVETTALRPDLNVLDFAAAADDFAQFAIAFPKSWNEGTITYQPFWTVTGTNTGTVVWQLGGVAITSDESLNTAFGTLVATTALAHSGTSNDLMVSAESGAVTIAGSPAANDQCFFQINNDTSASGQTGVVRLLGVKLFFTTDAANDA